LTLLLQTTLTRLFSLYKKKHKKEPQTGYEDQFTGENAGYPRKWFEQVSIIDTFPTLTGYTKVYVFITNANIPKKAQEVLEEFKKRNIIIIDQSVASSFFSLNIFPYISSVEE